MTDSELLFDLDRAIIVVHFYAESERGRDESQRLTYSHVAAITRQEFSMLTTDDLSDIDRQGFSMYTTENISDIDGETIRSSAIKISRKIEDIIQAKVEITADITLMEHDLNNLIYNKILSKYPCLSHEEFENDLDNMDFLNSLDRSPAYEKIYLQLVRSKYAEVSEEMKEGLGLD